MVTNFYADFDWQNGSLSETALILWFLYWVLYLLTLYYYSPESINKTCIEVKGETKIGTVTTDKGEGLLMHPHAW